jgi:predicted Zn-dependent protease
LALAPDDESALAARLNALALEGNGTAARELAGRALARHPHSGALRVAAADALWHGGSPLAAEVLPGLSSGIEQLKGEDRFRVDLALADHHRRLGHMPQALAAYGAVLAYQGDQPEALWGRAATLALDGQWDAAFTQYEAVLRLRTGLLALRRDYALDLLRAGRREPARAQIKAALLLDPRDPDTLALQAWLALADGDATAAQRGASEALALGPWSDLAVIVQAGALQAQGQGAAAQAALAPLRQRIAAATPPRYVYRPEKSEWLSVHTLPAAERRVMELLVK